MGMAAGNRVDVAEMSGSAPVVTAAGYFEIGFRVSNPATSSVVTIRNIAGRRLSGSLNAGAGTPAETFSLDAGATYQKAIDNTTSSGQQVPSFTLAMEATKMPGVVAMAMITVINALNMPTPGDPTGAGFNGASINAAAMWPD